MQPEVIPPDALETVTDRPGRNVAIRVGTDAITITQSLYGPGERGPDPHVHDEHTDAFYVTHGALRFGIAGEERVVGAGGFVAIPPGVVHTFLNDADEDARFVNIHAPSCGFDAFMRGGQTSEWDSRAADPADSRPASEAVVVDRLGPEGAGTAHVAVAVLDGVLRARTDAVAHDLPLA